jgi:NADH:ubiquinone oxidoreductase subunit C
MYGLKFLFHVDLRKILLDYNFLGHPLKKDFPLVGYFELRYDDLMQLLISEPVELSQNLRYFDFENP